jgi:hypothetical protein
LAGRSQLSLGFAAPAFLAGATQGFGERPAARLLLRLARRRTKSSTHGNCRAACLALALAPAAEFVI